ncbi:MAG: SAM-dependent methyltransferase [Corynebacterium sp.]|uniref:THUMP-like domain-containing protein n=1 Tax=Corynebacterium sp. TaxID=1720 RepID=UPI0026DBD35E|nr:SAM-dependent methyltransferase [Corynebacterium sp.]MDO5098456.1 SAM-dependent methyltransferase [Corynebacterium sp.]
MSFTPTEVDYLRAHATEIAATLSQRRLSKEIAVADADFFRNQHGDYGRAVLELATARSKSAGKLPADWLMCNESAQQATPLLVADIRADRIHAVMPDALVHDVTCSIGTEGAAIRSYGMDYLGSDIDLSRLKMAKYNLELLDNRATINQLGWCGIVASDALNPGVADAAGVVIADPARRSGGRRIVKPEDLIPPLPTLISAYPYPELAIKCAPGLDFSSWDGLVSVVSLNGGVKEACLYTPGLSLGVRREAVIIRGARAECDIIDDTHPDEVVVSAPGKFIIDPDGAIVRAGLVRHYANREGLWMLDERIAYLTGDVIPAGTSGFEYMETVSLKKLKSVLHSYDCGSVEILVRGLDIDPDALRKKLKLTGSAKLAVVLTRIGSAGVALVCKARQWA